MFESNFWCKMIPKHNGLTYNDRYINALKRGNYKQWHFLKIIIYSVLLTELFFI